MATKKLVTKRFKVESAKTFKQSITNKESAYYMFTGKHTPYEPDDSTVVTPTDSTQTVISAFNDMIFGKRITDSDVALMIPKHEWTSGTIYDRFDHEDGEIFDKVFYCIVNNGATYDVYKCLDNNNGGPSTVEPSGTDIDPIYSPVDGYLWKYMFTIPDIIYNKFKTTNYVPIVSNSSVIAGATEGTIEAIKVVDGGLGYDNYFHGSFGPDEIRIDGNEIIYGLPGSASLTPDFYQGCIIKITSGNAAGEYRQITNYAIENGYKKIYIDRSFDTTPSVNDTYEIYPFVFVYGNGTETANCMARAIVSPEGGNTISRVEILSAGAGYRGANTYLQVEGVLNVVRSANLSPIISPIGGHGSDPYQELGANRIGISIKFANSESGYIPDSNDYRTVGIIKDPLFTGLDVSLQVGNTQGVFLSGESVYQYRDIVLAGEVSVTSGSKTVVGTNTYFDTSLEIGDTVHINAGLQHHFDQVTAITNATHFTVASNINFTDTSCIISIVDNSLFGEVYAYSTGTLSLQNVPTKDLSNSGKIYGASTHAASVIDNTILLNGTTVNGDYNTYVQLSKFVGELTSGAVTFEEDELVEQESALEYYTPEAYFHSFIEGGSGDVMYVSNYNHIFNTNTVVYGVDSQASFNLSNKYLGDLVKDSGQIIYMENIEPITRLSNRTETVKVILEF